MPYPEYLSRNFPVHKDEVDDYIKAKFPRLRNIELSTSVPMQRPNAPWLKTCSRSVWQCK